MNTHPITGAELQTLREACGLSREELGELAHVQARTVKHWESGRAGVPADVATLAHQLAELLHKATVHSINATIKGMPVEHALPVFTVVLLRYQTPQDLARYRPDMAGLTHSMHGVLIGRVRVAMLVRGFAVRVVWMRPEAYEAWRSAERLPDTEGARAAWAAQQIEAQALPHRADQPPA